MLNTTRKKAVRQMLSISAAAMLLCQSNTALIANATATADSSRITTAVTAASAYKNWKQYNAAWANLPVGKFGGDMRSIGCAVTAAAILCAASHSAVPDGFDPGVLCDFLTKNGGFSTSGDLQWQVIPKLVPDFCYESTRTFSSKNQREQITELASYLADGYFVAVKLTQTIAGTRTSHFVAIDRIENGVVYMFDPGSNYDVLYDKYSSYMLESVRLFRGADSPTVTVPESPDQQSVGAYLTTTRLNLRSGAGTEHKVLTVLPKDTHIEITEVAEDWGKTSYNGMDGWVNMRYCTPAVSIFTTGDYSTNDQTLTLHSAPVNSATAVGYLPPNTLITVTTVNGDWGYCTHNGKSGWVALRYCICRDGNADMGVSLRYTTAENSMRLRTGPSTSTAMLTMLPPDTTFTVIQIEGNWGKTVYEGQIGWIYIPYCTLIADDAPETPALPEEPMRVLYTTGNYNLRLRADANTTSETLAYIGTDTQLIITQVHDGWGKTTYNGKEGWVYLAYCTLVTEHLPTEPVTPALPEEPTRDLYTTGNYNLRLRADANTTSETLAYIGTDTQLIITQVHDGWGKTTYNGKEGWVYLAYCTLITDDTPSTHTSPWLANLGNCVVVADGLYVYTEINNDNAMADIIKLGTHIMVVDIESDWAKIQWNGSSGWIRLGEYGTPYVYLAGDVTLDGTVDICDHKLMEAFFSGVALPDALQMLVADINGDGSVNAADRAILAQKGE